jgi:phage shock protein A
MGIFRRMASLVRGFFSGKVGEIEERNPDALIEDLKHQIEKTANEAEKQVIEIQTGAELIKAEMKNARNRLDTVRARIEAAKNKRDMELLTELIVQEEDCLKEYEGNKQMYEKAMEEVSRIREDYRIFESEMNAKLSELRSLKSRSRIASLRENIISLNTKYSAKNKRLERLNQSFDRLRETVDIKTARAKAYQAVVGEDPEIKLKKLDIEDRRINARKRAEALLNQTGDNVTTENEKAVTSK